MAEDSDLEKTEDPSDRRKEQAREKGQVPHSRELGTFLLLLVGASAMWVMGAWLVQRGMMIMHKGLVMDVAFLKEPHLALVRLGDMGTDALLSFAPLLGVLVLAAILPPFLLNAFVFAPGTLAPDFSRLNPMTGIGRMFSWNGLAELFKSVIKAVLVGGVAALVVWSQRDEMLSLLSAPLNVALGNMGHLLSFSFLMIVLSLALVAAVDVPFQLWQYFEKLKMTKEEVKQEMKESQGDPMVKGRIRQLQREASRRRMMAAVPTADVIVTNPTHFAVALSYKSGMAAPKVLAKGMGLVAQKIKQLGAEHGVPMMEAPPLARALFKHTELEQTIPAGLYAAVAEVLAYVYQINHWRLHGGMQPRPPRDLDVPAELAVAEVA